VQQAQALLDHPPDEEGITDDVAFPEAAGFDDETAQPLQAVGAGRRVIQRGARWSSPEM